MFDRLRFKIGFYFMLVVIGTMIAYGAIFIPLDYRDYINELDDNLASDAEKVIALMNWRPEDAIGKLTERDSFRIRIFNTNGAIVYSGKLFSEQESTLNQEPFIIKHFNDRFRIQTYPIELHDTQAGHVQVGEVYHVFFEDLREKVLILLLESMLIAIMIYFVGLYFAKHALAPAVSMYQRLDQFSQDASHELKTPLANAMSSLDLALVDEKPHEHIEDAKKNMHQAAEIVDDLLELAKLTRFTLQKEEIDLSQLTRGVAKEFAKQARIRRVHLMTNIEDDVSVEADAGYVLMLLTNLVNNALKFSEAGDKVQINLDSNTLTVHDKGIGIDPELVERLFDPFFQADSSRATEGLGLGLSIVKKIVDAHNWKIDVQSIKGVGTSFVITFA